MFAWLKRKQEPLPSGDGILATHPPMQVFPWPKGATITAVDEVVLALPVRLLDKDRPMNQFLFGPEDMEINVPSDSDEFFVRLKPGMSISLAKSCESYIVAEDKNLRRLKVKRPSAQR